jgi:hypothetical protein
MLAPVAAIAAGFDRIEYEVGRELLKMRVFHQVTGQRETPTLPLTNGAYERPQ